MNAFHTNKGSDMIPTLYFLRNHCTKKYKSTWPLFSVLSPFFNTYKQRQLVNTASVLSSVQGRMSEKDSHLGKCPTHENTLITSKTF